MKVWGFSRKERGFTLIELMFVVAIISILVTLVLPSYQHMTQKAERAEAQTLLLEVQSHLERYYFHHQRYPDKLSSLRHFSEDKIESNNAYYEISLSGESSACPAMSCYKLIARHSNGQEKETLSITSSGEKQGPW